MTSILRTLNPNNQNDLHCIAYVLIVRSLAVITPSVLSTVSGCYLTGVQIKKNYDWCLCYVLACGELTGSQDNNDGSDYVWWCQCRDEARHESRESSETRRQTEEDADRELLNMRVRHEKVVRDEQVTTRRQSPVHSHAEWLSACITLCCNTVSDIITSRVSRRRRKMYCGHARLCVCLSVRGRIPTLLHEPGCNLGSRRGCLLVVHCWADLQSVHGLRCYGNITRTRNVSEYMLVLAVCLVELVVLEMSTVAVYSVRIPITLSDSRIPVCTNSRIEVTKDWPRTDQGLKWSYPSPPAKHASCPLPPAFLRRRYWRHYYHYSFCLISQVGLGLQRIFNI